MKRCSWNTTTSTTGSPTRQSLITPYACVDASEQIALNQVIQRTNGDYVKCAEVASSRDGLAMRGLTADELAAHLMRKTRNLNLIEYYGTGARSSTQQLVHAFPASSTRRKMEPNGCCFFWVKFDGTDESVFQSVSTIFRFVNAFPGTAAWHKEADSRRDLHLSLTVNFETFSNVSKNSQIFLPPTINFRTVVKVRLFCR